MNVNIQSIRFKADQKLLDYMEKKYSKLGKYFDNIVDLNIRLSLERTGQVQDKIVELALKVPGETLLSKSSEKTFEKAFDETFEHMKRLIHKYKEKKRGL